MLERYKVKNNKTGDLLKLAVTIVILPIITSALIAAYLFYKGKLNAIAFSEGAFYAAIAYIALAITPIYEVLTSSNFVSYTYGEYAVKGKIDAEDRISDVLSKKNYKFSISMAAAGAVLFTISSLAVRFF